jgi:hypothetical protein
MLGWVGTATDAVNDTLNTFVDETNKVLDVAFGNTPLRDPIQEVLNCLILLKVQGIQKALTWVHDNAHINMPALPNDTFSMGALSGESQAFLANPDDNTSDKLTTTVIRVIDYLEAGVRQEAIISSFILLLYVFVCMCGAGAAFYRAHFGRDKARGEGGSVLKRNSVGPSVFAGTMDFRSDDQDRFTKTIPMTTVSVRHHDPAPEYSEAINPATRNPFASTEEQYQDSKLGHGAHSSDEKRGDFI